MKKVLKILLSRVAIVAMLMLVQLALLLVMIFRFSEYFIYFYAASLFISIGIILKLISDRSNPAYKMVWLILVLLVPVFGVLMFCIFGSSRLSKREQKKLRSIYDTFAFGADNGKDAAQKLRAEDADAANQSRYIADYALSPVYQCTSSEYLPVGEVKFERMVEELKQAKHYIFLEYFIIREGVMWNTILDILVQKVKEGVEVRVMYDDMGCIMTLPSGYYKKLRELGIKCCVFNPFVPVLSSRFNNRDHRKICVIDGCVGFTGGINLADEYINLDRRLGHWKDTAVLLKGEAVWSLTLMFLSVWGYVTHTAVDYEKYRPHVHAKPVEGDGFVQPYNDSPLDGEPVGENVYLNLIYKAKRYVYITTPYLIISNEMITALCSAAKQGVDVRIITPFIPDKWFVHAVTRSYYEVLVEAGVKIFEYTPGFIHAKTFVADDSYGIVGTINLDYRSLYLHFECATWLYQTRSVIEMKGDFAKTQALSKPITLEDCRAVSWPRRLGRTILRVFAPLM